MSDEFLPYSMVRCVCRAFFRLYAGQSHERCPGCRAAVRVAA